MCCWLTFVLACPVPCLTMTWLLSRRRWMRRRGGIGEGVHPVPALPVRNDLSDRLLLFLPPVEVRLR